MHTGPRLRRAASGAFILALLALLMMPVGSMTRAANAQTSAGAPKTKVTPIAARSLQTTAYDHASDRLQLDPVTIHDPSIEPSRVMASPTDHTHLPTPDPRRGDPSVRGPPAR